MTVDPTGRSVSTLILQPVLQLPSGPDRPRSYTPQMKIESSDRYAKRLVQTNNAPAQPKRATPAGQASSIQSNPQVKSNETAARSSQGTPSGRSTVGHRVDVIA